MAGGVVNLALSSLVIGTGLTLNGSTLSVTANTSVTNSVVAAAGSALTLAANDSSGGTIVLGIANILTTTAAFQGLNVRVNNQSGGYTLTSTDLYVGYTGGGGQTFTLPDATTNLNRVFIIKNRGGGALTVARSGTDQIWTTAGVTSISLLVGEAVMLISDGAWQVVSMASGIITP